MIIGYIVLQVTNVAWGEMVWIQAISVNVYIVISAEWLIEAGIVQ